MIKISKVVRNGQVTIPSPIRKSLHIQDGDFVRLDVKNNQLIITPVSVINKDQSYFFTEKWQKAIHASEKAIHKGEHSVYHSAKELREDIEHD